MSGRNLRRVVVTGMGVVSPVGSTVEDAWKNIVDGRSGIRPIERFDVSDFATRFGGSVVNFDLDAYVPKKLQRQSDSFIHYGIAAADQAIKGSGLEITEQNAAKIGVAMGSGIGGIETIETNYKKYLDSGSPRKISPFFVPGSIINMISGHVSILHGLKGPNFAVVTACTTGSHNIAMAARSIQVGDADAMVAGGAEMSTSTLGLGGFCSARALSSRNDDPQSASRPWDADRDGFVLSDGAAAMMIEEYEHAKARGANILAEFIGVGMSADAYHATAPSEDGAGAAMGMQFALEDAGIQADDVDYINAHATSTKLGDIAEANAIKKVFAGTKVAVSSTKSVTGHLLGAAGAIEGIIAVLALRDQVAPPTINLDNVDNACAGLDFVPNQAKEMPIDIAVSNSFGFGGTNASIIFKRI